MEPAVFLDRDNTLIANDGDLGDPGAVRLLEGVPAGLQALRAAGYRLVVVTNQGGVARGAFTEADVDAVHQRIAALLAKHTGGDRLIDRFYYCPYHPEGTVESYRRDHVWRKPAAGMLLQAARDLGLDLARSWMIGDQPRDIEAGQAGGTRTILLGRSAVEGAPRPTAVAPAFGDAVQFILRRTAGPLRGSSGTRHGAAGGTDDVALATAVAEPKPKMPPAARPGRDQPTREPQAPAASAAVPTELIAAVRDLSEEIRNQRQRGAEWTALRMLAVVGQLVALLLALQGLLHLETLEPYVRWMVGAAIVQLLTITALIADLKG